MLKRKVDHVNCGLVHPRESQKWNHYFHRVRLGHTLEFGYWTGLWRQEISNLKFSQFDKMQDALLDVVRFKTSDLTEVFPIAPSAIETIEERRELQKATPYIFTPNGNPMNRITGLFKMHAKSVVSPTAGFLVRMDL